MTIFPGSRVGRVLSAKVVSEWWMELEVVDSCRVSGTIMGSWRRGAEEKSNDDVVQKEETAEGGKARMDGKVAKGGGRRG